MNKNKTNDHNVDDNMINNESNNEEDKTHCVIKTSIIPKPPPLDIETITKKIKLQRFDTFTNKIIEKIKTRKKNIENNVNPVDTVEQIKEDLNKDYYIMDNEDNTTENNNVLLSSSRKRLFKSIVKEKETNEKLNEIIDKYTVYNLNPRRGFQLTQTESNSLLQLVDIEKKNTNRYPIDFYDKFQYRSEDHTKMTSFMNTISAIRWLNRLKIRIAKYGSIDRNPKLIVKNDENIFSTRNSFSIINMNRIISQKLIPWYIIKSENKYLRYWNLFIFILSLYIIIGLPYRIAFLDNVLVLDNKIIVFDIIVEIFFIIDFVIHCITSYYDKNGQLVYKLTDILKHYLSTWMILDFISIFPFYIIEWCHNDYYSKDIRYYFLLFKLPKFYRLLRVIKVLKMIQEMKCLVSIERMNASYGGVIKILTFIFSSFLICHIFACFWYFIARIDSNNESNWVNRYNFNDMNMFSLYLKSFYFSFTVFLTVGYGDITPYTNAEVILLSIWLIFCGIYYSFNLSILGSVFEESNQNSLLLNRLTRTIKEIAKNNRFPKRLEEKIIFYLINEYKNKDNIQSNEVNIKSILKELSIDLKYKIVLNIYNRRIKNINLFNECKKEFIANFVPLLDSKVYEKDTYIYKTKEVPEFIYFIIEGDIVLSTEDNIVFATISTGSFFGEIEIIRKTYRETNARTKTQSTLLMMKRKLIIEDIVQGDSVFLIKIIEIMIKRYKKYQKLIKIIHNIIEYGKRLCKQKKIFPRLRSSLSEITKQNSIAYFFYAKGLEFLITNKKEIEDIATEEIDELLMSTKKEELTTMPSNTNASMLNANVRRIRSSLYTLDNNTFDIKGTMMLDKNRVIHVNSITFFSESKAKEGLIDLNEVKRIKAKITKICNENLRLRHEIKAVRIQNKTAYI